MNKMINKPKEKKNKPSNKISFFSFTRFSTKKQTFFAKKLSFLIKAGVPMLESIIVIRKQTKNRSEIRIFEKVIADISNGQTLAGSLGKFKGTFGNFSINMIKSGESSGTLTDNLAYLADELKKKEMLKKKVMGALLYPIIVTIATFGITGFLALYIFPKILPIFQSLNAKLPASTRAVIWFTETLKHDGIYILIGVVLFITILSLLIRKVSKIKYLYDGLILRIPLFGKMSKSYNLTNTTRTLGLLLKSGIPLNESIHITSETTENMQYKKAFIDMSETVVKGKNISEFLNSHNTLFPSMIGHMVAIGEKSGNLSNTLIYLSEFYENEFDDLTKNLSSTIEPVLMVIMGLMVGFIAISVITPIYEITNSLHN
jgi:type IV pilus assembly protein PilC